MTTAPHGFSEGSGRPEAHMQLHIRPPREASYRPQDEASSLYTNRFISQPTPIPHARLATPTAAQTASATHAPA
eukprot:scaffold75437_cov51-Phaeocystis_antarctica.AAC.1